MFVKRENRQSGGWGKFDVGGFESRGENFNALH